MERKYEVIIFDFDYTLFDYEATEKIAVKAAFEALNLPYQESYHTKFKHINRQIWADSERDRRIDKTALRIERFKQLFEQLGIPSASDLAKLASEEYIKYSEQGVLIPGVAETILELKKRYPLVIASSGLSNPRLQKLRNSKISNCFRHVLFREQFEENKLKPHHEFFDKLSTLYNVPREKILYVGDSFAEDIEGSKNAGFSNVFFNFFHILDREIEFDKCDYVIENFDELLSIVGL